MDKYDYTNTCSFTWDMITYPCLNFNSDLTEPPLNLAYGIHMHFRLPHYMGLVDGRVIISHRCNMDVISNWLLIRALIPMLV